MGDRLRQDLFFAVRSVLRARGASAVAIASLAIGIAANATVFSLVQAVEFPTLIYPHASRIVFLESKNEARGLIGMPVSAPDAMDIAAASRTLAMTSLTAGLSSVLRERLAPIRVSGRRVTPSFFDVMGVAPRLGRFLTTDDGPEAVVLSDRIWRTEFSGNGSIVGRPVRLDGGLVTIVGVMPPRFDPDSDLWVRLSPSLAFSRDDRQFTTFARLAPESSLDDATVELAHISGRLEADQPATNQGWVTFPVALTRMHGRDSRGAFILLQAAVAFLLLIACANIANILLARGSRRRHEMAVRISLGASRRRLLSALLIESVLLSLTGGAIGILLSMWGIRIARTVGGFPDTIDPQLNVVVLAFTAALSMLTGVLCGLVPALKASSVVPEAVLRADDGRSGDSRGRLRSTLVAVQVASALVLATCAALMLQSLANRQRLDLGFDPRGAIRASLDLPQERYDNPGARRAAVDALIEQLRDQPDVLAAGAVTWALPTGAGGQRHLSLPADRDRMLPSAIRRGVEAVTPDYFSAIAAPVKIGRTFTQADHEHSVPVAVVNEELASHLWPDRNPIGEPLRLGAQDEQAPVVTVVGIVSTIRRSAMHDVPVARVYVPFAQHPNATMTIVVRSRGNIGSAGLALRHAVNATDPAILVEGLRTMEAELADFVAPIRMIGWLLAAFGVAGLMLAGLGVFGTMSYTVSQRERELAVRAALGADRRRLVRLVFTSALKITGAGLIAGIVLAAAATRVLATFLFGVSASDPLTFATVIVFLTVVSLVASYRPARIAATTEPMILLRG